MVSLQAPVLQKHTGACCAVRVRVPVDEEDACGSVGAPVESSAVWCVASDFNLSGHRFWWVCRFGLGGGCYRDTAALRVCLFERCHDVDNWSSEMLDSRKSVLVVGPSFEDVCHEKMAPRSQNSKQCPIYIRSLVNLTRLCRQLNEFCLDIQDLLEAGILLIATFLWALNQAMAMREDVVFVSLSCHTIASSGDHSALIAETRGSGNARASSPSCPPAGNHDRPIREHGK